jgi:hypothetical protein
MSPEGKPEPDEREWDADDPLIEGQPSTWIYWNPRGQVVIRQKGEVFEDDPYVMFTVENLPALIADLRCKLAESAGAHEDVPEPEIEEKSAKPPNPNAERQRRYRQKRNADRNARNAQSDERYGETATDLLLRDAT